MTEEIRKYATAQEVREKLYQEEDVELNGKLFRIRRIGPLDFMDMEQLPKLFELAGEAAKEAIVKKVDVQDLIKDKVEALDKSSASMVKTIKEGEIILAKGLVIPKVSLSEADKCGPDEVPASYFSNDLNLLMGLTTRILLLMIGGVKTPFPDKPEQGAAGVPDGQPVS